MKLKNGVNISKIHPDFKELIPKIDTLWELCFPGNDLVITSGHEEIKNSQGKLEHTVLSKHYIHNNPSGYGCAIDVRINDVTLNEGHYYLLMVMMFIKLFFDDRIEVIIEKIPQIERHLHFQVKNN